MGVPISMHILLEQVSIHIQIAPESKETSYKKLQSIEILKS